MPLNDHEQRILEEIERRLAEDDPKLVEQVGRTDLYTHLAPRIRLACFAFVVGFVLLVVLSMATRGVSHPHLPARAGLCLRARALISG